MFILHFNNIEIQATIQQIGTPTLWVEGRGGGLISG